MEDNNITIIVSEQDTGQRIDRFLVERCDGLSRERIKDLLKSGAICLSDGTRVKPSAMAEEGQIFSVTIPEADDPEPQPENIPLDIIFEDDDVIVINKAAGMVVHPAAGNWTGTLVNALLYHCADTLSGVGGVKRPGIVHRLDKETSGVMLVAKNDHTHAHLSAQLADRSLTRIYEALVWDIPVPPIGKIDLPIGRDHKNRLKQAIKHAGGTQSRDAVTHYKTLETYGEGMARVECKLETGRTHQIRVHMQSLGHCLIGDPLYGAQKTLQISRAGKLPGGMNKDSVLNFPRQALHARDIAFIHPRTGEHMSFATLLPDDMAMLMTMDNTDGL